ncbi:AAA family ATPase [Microbacterium sp. ARD32]|uniref:AAA family ATPase n=1 Tax=Microbacterium sp. ARD32 TaxID=2962577 RepID=UPI002881B588|nr:AAA family ATPase [Microbacterium sp. ARD32]MDT0158198.1 AAA family ATPase [Microbacterium sp. ARD32]
MTDAGAARCEGFPSWLGFVDSVLPVTSLFVVHGNLRDLHLVPDESGFALHRTASALRALLERSGIPALVHCSMLHGLSVVAGGDETVARAALGTWAARIGDGRLTPDEAAAVMLQVNCAREHPCAVMVDYVSQTAVHPDGHPAETSAELHRAMLRVAHEGAVTATPTGPRSMRRNSVFVLVDRPGDLPAWVLSGDGIRQVPIPKPDLATRTRAVRSILPQLFGVGRAEPSTQEEVAQQFVGATHDMSLRALIEIVQLQRDAGLPPQAIADAARLYRVGAVADPWRSPELTARIAEGEDLLQRRVKGQPRAVRHALDVLIRSVTGLSAAHRTHGAGPRGVMFMAGPTGVGKTELAKAIASLLFGDESACIRFDMSEFAQEAADQRLIGSPPGFANHEAGGELTNAVRDQPFSVLLFDEIEKAHPRVLDKFLQLLSDGRLSDGSGDTVFFHECLIVFTSNLGVGTDGTRAEDSRSEPLGYERRVTEEVHRVLGEELNRPELLGRIGDNVIVFDYLTDDIAAEITEGYMDNVERRIARTSGIGLHLSDEAREHVRTIVLADLSKGARGIGSALETALVNPLARALFAVPEGSARTLIALETGDDGVISARLDG